MAEASNGVVETTAPQTKTDAPPIKSDGTGGDSDAGKDAPATSTPATPAPAIPAPNSKAPKSSGAFAPVILKKRYQIYPGQPLPEFDGPSAKAFAAEDQRDPSRALYAMVCSPGLPPRTKVMGDLRNLTIYGLISLVEFGPVEWEPLGQKAMLVVFERPLGGRLIDAFSKGPVRINEYELGKKIIEPITQALERLKDLNIPHRAIRIENIYFLDEGHEELILGECVTTPSGYDQPTIYEPVERALAMNSGRGEGTILDDLYALGIMSTLLLLGRNPVEKLSDEIINAKKMEVGTYQAICGDERIPLALIEPLRGLLSDSAEERWDTVALETWVNGQKKTPMQKRPTQKPKKPYLFAGNKHVTPRTIAQAFSTNINEAAKAIKSEKISLWLKSSMMKPQMAEEINTIIASATASQGTPDGSDEIMVAKVVMRMDPEGPIRYKNFSFLPDGFAVAIAAEWTLKNSFQIPSEILARDLVGYWFSCQTSYIDFLSYEKTFSTLRSFFKINEMGYGVERCMYELNPSLPCQSELLRKQYVTHTEDVMDALDEVANTVDKKSRPMDKHLAAYIATHFKYDIAPHLKTLSDPKEETSLIGMLSLFALMQWRLKTPAVYGLSRWLGGLLSPAISSYHSRSTRRSIEHEIPTLVRQGSLPELFDLIDNAQRREQDNTDFDDAEAEFALAETEILKIVGEEVDQNDLALKSGERATAVMSIVISMTAVSVLLIINSI
ncbi:MAG: serine/threonine protein kinase [Rhodospirillaceae bacterium]|nr:serine/threonine protein kinase [Rhodospirillaceae bacterium]